MEWKSKWIYCKVIPIANKYEYNEILQYSKQKHVLNKEFVNYINMFGVFMLLINLNFAHFTLKNDNVKKNKKSCMVLIGYIYNY